MVSGTISLPSRGTFHHSLTVLSTIGHQEVFRLSEWSRQIHSTLHESAATREHHHTPTTHFRLPDSHRLWSGFPTCSTNTQPNAERSVALSNDVPQPRTRNPYQVSHAHGLASSAFARHYSRNHQCFLFLRVLRCFTSPRYHPHPYTFRAGPPDTTPDIPGFPIRTPPDHSSLTNSPGLIAGHNVLHRLLVPRHPPIALHNFAQHHVAQTHTTIKILASTIQFSTTTRTPHHAHTHATQHRTGHHTCDTPQPNSMPSTPPITGRTPTFHSQKLLRKEVIQPHLPVRLPCYDLVLITSPTFDGSPTTVRPPASGVTNFHDLTGGVYKPRERIHRSVADLRLLATPTS